MSVLRKMTAAAALAFAAGAAHAQVSDGVIRIGVLNDQSSLYADLAGQGSVIAARMAVEDFGAAKKGMKVEIVSADHQNKPDVGSAIARQWYDVDKVDVIFDVPNSGARARPVERGAAQGRGGGSPRPPAGVGCRPPRVASTARRPPTATTTASRAPPPSARPGRPAVCT